MKGGEMSCGEITEQVIKETKNNGGFQRRTKYSLCCTKNGKTKCEQKSAYGTNTLNKSSILPSMRNRIKVLFDED